MYGINYSNLSSRGKRANRKTLEQLFFEISEKSDDVWECENPDDKYPKLIKVT